MLPGHTGAPNLQHRERARHTHSVESQSGQRSSCMGPHSSSDPRMSQGHDQYTGTLVYLVLVLLMICNRNGITSVGRGEFVESSLKLSLKISWQSLWQSILPYLLPQKMIVRISLKFRQRFRCFNSSLTKFQRSFGRNFDDFFLWQNVVAKRFATRKISSKRERGRNFALWQNVLPQHFATKKIVEISLKISLLQFKF